MPFLSEILGGDQIPLEKLAYFRERFRDRLYEAVVSEFLKREASGLTKADVARRIGRRPEQITRWLGAPGNWTLETVSDLLLAITASEPEIRLVSLAEQPRRNYSGQDFVSGESRQPITSRESIGTRTAKFVRE